VRNFERGRGVEKRGVPDRGTRDLAFDAIIDSLSIHRSRARNMRRTVIRGFHDPYDVLEEQA
jgi:hypothetical protein